MATLIRAFADHARAQRLHDELLEAGLSGDRVRLLRGDQAGTEAPGERGVLSSLGHVFASALGGDSPDESAGRYTEALQRGEAVIAVDARTATEEGLARAILEGAGAGTPGAGR